MQQGLCSLRPLPLLNYNTSDFIEKNSTSISFCIKQLTSSVTEGLVWSNNKSCLHDSSELIPEGVQRDPFFYFGCCSSVSISTEQRNFLLCWSSKVRFVRVCCPIDQVSKNIGFNCSKKKVYKKLYTLISCYCPQILCHRGRRTACNI